MDPETLTKLGATSGNLQQAEDHMFLIFSHDQIVRFE